MVHELWAHASNHDRREGEGGGSVMMGLYIVDSLRFQLAISILVHSRPTSVLRINVSFRHDPLRVLTVKSR